MSEAICGATPDVALRAHPGYMLIESLGGERDA
jgi:hypothetical protein